MDVSKTTFHFPFFLVFPVFLLSTRKHVSKWITTLFYFIFFTFLVERCRKCTCTCCCFLFFLEFYVFLDYSTGNRLYLFFYYIPILKNKYNTKTKIFFFYTEKNHATLASKFWSIETKSNQLLTKQTLVTEPWCIELLKPHKQTKHNTYCWKYWWK